MIKYRKKAKLDDNTSHLANNNKQTKIKRVLFISTRVDSSHHMYEIEG